MHFKCQQQMIDENQNSRDTSDQTKRKKRTPQENALKEESNSFLKRPVPKIANLNQSLKDSYGKEHFKEPRFQFLKTLKNIRNGKEKDSLSSSPNDSQDEEFKMSNYYKPKKTKLPNGDNEEQTQPKKRGRPPKIVNKEQNANNEPQPAKKRGRPKGSTNKKKEGEGLEPSKATKLTQQQKEKIMVSNDEESELQSQASVKETVKVQQAKIQEKEIQKKEKNTKPAPKDNLDAQSQKFSQEDSLNIEMPKQGKTYELPQQSHLNKPNRQQQQESSYSSEEEEQSQEEDDNPQDNKQKKVDKKLNTPIQSSATKMPQSIKIQEAKPQKNQIKLQSQKDPQSEDQEEYSQSLEEQASKEQIQLNAPNKQKQNSPIDRKDDFQPIQKNQRKKSGDSKQESMANEDSSNSSELDQLAKLLKKRGRKSKADHAEIERLTQIIENKKTQNKTNLQLSGPPPTNTASIKKNEPPVTEPQKAKHADIPLLPEQSQPLLTLPNNLQNLQQKIIAKLKRQKINRLKLASKQIFESIMIVSVLSSDQKKLFKKWAKYLESNQKKHRIVQSESEQEITSEEFYIRRPKKEKVKRYRKMIIEESDLDQSPSWKREEGNKTIKENTKKIRYYEKHVLPTKEEREIVKKNSKNGHYQERK